MIVIEDEPSTDFAAYGAETTFHSSTTAARLESSSFTDNALRAAFNVVCSVVPHPLHSLPSSHDPYLHQPSSVGWWRDYFFIIYQPNVIFGVGSVGGPLAVYLLARALLDRSVARAVRGFWLMFVVLATVVGIAAHPTPNSWGVAHICNQPMTLLAAEVNVVRTRRLWPRSLAPPPLGGADERALQGLARQEERLPDQRVEVSFGTPGDAEMEERPAQRGPPAQTR